MINFNGQSCVLHVVISPQYNFVTPVTSVSCEQDFTDDITAGISASVQHYITSAVPNGVAAPEINMTLEAHDESVCNGNCHYTFNDFTGMTALYYSITVIAKNVLHHGYSEGRMCNNIPICKIKNELELFVFYFSMCDC